jgi:hypothetical protein
MSAGPAGGPGPGEPRGAPDALLPPPGRLIMYAGTFLVGYLLATAYSSWERQRYIEAEVASNGVAALLRLGLADELDQLQRDLSAVGPPLDAAQAKSTKADLAFGDVRQQLAAVSRRAGIVKEKYGNTPAVDDYLRRLLLEKYYAQAPGPRPDQGPSKPMEPKDDAEKKAAAAAPAEGKKS